MLFPRLGGTSSRGLRSEVHIRTVDFALRVMALTFDGAFTGLVCGSGVVLVLQCYLATPSHVIMTARITPPLHQWRLVPRRFSCRLLQRRRK